MVEQSSNVQTWSAGTKIREWRIGIGPRHKNWKETCIYRRSFIGDVGYGLYEIDVLL